MMSMQSSTHSSQMNTVGPAISLRTSCWLLPQKEQYRVFFESLLVDFVIAFLWPEQLPYDQFRTALVTGLLNSHERRTPKGPQAAFFSVSVPPGRFSTTSSTRPK